MTNYMNCDTKDLPEAAKQKAVDWANEVRLHGRDTWHINDVKDGFGVAYIARYIATQEPATESHEAAAKRIADKYWAEPSNLWFAAQSSIRNALNNGDLLLPPQPVDPDLVNARILATKASLIGTDYTNGKNDNHWRVQEFYGCLKSGLIKMGDGV